MKSDGKIIFLTPGFPQNESDSTCLPYLQNYIRSLTTLVNKEEIHIIAFQYPYERGPYKWNGIEVFSAGGKNRGHFFRLFCWGLVFKQVLVILRTSDIQLIHSFWIGETSLLGYGLAQMFHLKHVMTIMGQDAIKKTWMHFFIDFKKVHLTCVSFFAAELFRKQLSSHPPLVVIPWGIDQNEVLTHRNGRSRSIDILGVGSLTKQKNYDLFLDIVIELKKRLPQVKVVLIGNGHEHGRLSTRIQQSGLQDTVELCGLLPRHEVIKHMWNSKIFLHTSCYESQGYVFMEALQCGMYTVSFKVGYIPSSVKSFISESEEEMISTLSRLLSSQLSFDSIPLRSMEETAKDYLNIYSQTGA